MTGALGTGGTATTAVAVVCCDSALGLSAVSLLTLLLLFYFTLYL